MPNYAETITITMRKARSRNKLIDAIDGEQSIHTEGDVVVCSVIWMVDSGK